MALLKIKMNDLLLPTVCYRKQREETLISCGKPVTPRVRFTLLRLGRVLAAMVLATAARAQDT